MQTETHYKTRLTINILMASMTCLLLAIFIFNIKLPCVFNELLHIRCLTCGLTRSFQAILNLNFLESLKQNILGIPLFIAIILIYIIFAIDLIFKKKTLIRIYERMCKHYILIIISLIILTIINNF